MTHWQYLCQCANSRSSKVDHDAHFRVSIAALCWRNIRLACCANSIMIVSIPIQVSPHLHNIKNGCHPTLRSSIIPVVYLTSDIGAVDRLGG
ncbi:hypothetical protein ABKN59_006264 [Abortiporus biennis]